MGKKITVKDDEDYLNILLLGETGVGKSTFINSFANYLLHPKFEDAKTAKLLHLIPTKFMAETADKEQILVTSSRSKNEDEVFGNSSTLGARSYIFTIEGTTYRIIDTPGIADARGCETDAQNFDNVLQYVGQFKYLHAICILVQPNVTVLTTFFKYCVNELLSRLDKSASKNLVFVFTKSRAENYQAPNTIASLKIIADDMKANNIDMPINYGTANDNVFFFDNEAFKFLIAFQQGIDMHFPISAMMQSWEKSCQATWDLLTYINGDNKDKPGLQPHKVQDTLSINDARRLIVTLSKPLVDVTDVVHDNLLALKRQCVEVGRDDLAVEKLKEQLFTPTIDIEEKQLPYPVTVCTGENCLEIYKVFEVRKYHYGQRCHDPCYLDHVPHDIRGPPELKYCTAMGGTESCTECNCHFKFHMHIYYETTAVEKSTVNSTALANFELSGDFSKAKLEHLQELKNTATAYKKEEEAIAEAMVKFALFIKHNSMCPINEAYEDYLDMLISRESEPKGDRDLLERYRILKKEHIEQKQLLKEATQDGDETVTAEDIVTAVQNLFDLPLMGSKIRTLYEIMKAGGRTEQKEYTERVVDMSQIQRPTFNLEEDYSTEQQDNIDLAKSLLAQGRIAEASALLALVQNV